MSFNVTKIIDGDTFEVDPDWKWDDNNGDRVRIANFDATELNDWGGKSAKQKLEDLIEGENVELKNPVNLSYGRLVCDVYYKGKDVKKQLS